MIIKHKNNKVMKTKAILIILMFTLFLGTTAAQDNSKRFGVELSGGLSMSTNKLGGSTLNPGFGFEGTLHYRFMPHLGVYGGWGWNRFGAEESFAGNDVCFEETGYVLGLQFMHPFGDSKTQYYLRAGGLYAHIETENQEGEVFNDTGHGWGWQLAGGLDIPMGKNWSFTPGVKFNSLSKDSDFDGVSKELNHNYVSLRVGFVKRF
jgi:hypothetical protein